MIKNEKKRAKYKEMKQTETNVQISLKNWLLVRNKQKHLKNKFNLKRKLKIYSAFIEEFMLP